MIEEPLSNEDVAAALGMKVAAKLEIALAGDGRLFHREGADLWYEYEPEAAPPVSP